MLIKTHDRSQPLASEITPEGVWRERRRFTRLAAALAAGAALPGIAGAAVDLRGARPGQPSSGEPRTAFEDFARYNNFYEFGTGKDDPAANAHSLRTDPWSVRVEGECEKPGAYALEDFIKGPAIEERVYRLRCVEAWSMVIPWLGVPLGDVLKKFQPTAKAKYVAFETLHDPAQMPGQKRAVLEWPYREGLRMDEAMHPLTLLGVGAYGKPMPKQNGAPLRLVVPWKYGFKSIKSIVTVRFTEQQPPTSWNMATPQEYGFYSNVNPAVDHPRWSQKKERRIGGEAKGLLALLLTAKVDTLPFNGYAEQVAGLYTGMDLAKHY
jgi:sulfoxide reductase catalytic subunit YedY